MAVFVPTSKKSLFRMSNIKVQSKQVEPSRAESDSARLGDSAYASVCGCMLCGCKMTAGHRLATRAYRHVAFVLLRFCTWISLQPQFHLERNYITRKGIR